MKAEKIRIGLPLLLCGASLLALTGCDTIGEAFGMERTVPDENAVTTNPGLTLPPDYDLKPPRESPKTEDEDNNGPTDPVLAKPLSPQ